MLNDVVALPNGDFQVMPMRSNQERYLQRLREQRYAATQRNDVNVVVALDQEIQELIKRIS